MRMFFWSILISLTAGFSNPQVEEAGETLRVMTYNVNYGMAGDETTLQAVLAGDAEVVFLQETGEAWEPYLRTLEDHYPYMAFHTEMDAGGMAILSKYPFAEQAWTPSPIGWFPGWIVVVDSPIGDLQVLNVHLKPPIDDGSLLKGYFTTAKQRHAELSTYTALLDPELPTLVVGDFNEKNRKSTRMLKRRGMTDVLERYAPGAKTWQWHTSTVTLRATLDHVFVDEHLRAVHGEVLRVGRSDHFPVVAEVTRGGHPIPLRPEDNI
jgi:endonuclease/exonuclease/phosphatase (EEP) superfamily protein YafD